MIRCHCAIRVPMRLFLPGREPSCMWCHVKIVLAWTFDRFALLCLKSGACRSCWVRLSWLQRSFCRRTFWICCFWRVWRPLRPIMCQVRMPVVLLFRRRASGSSVLCVFEFLGHLVKESHLTSCEGYTQNGGKALPEGIALCRAPI